MILHKMYPIKEKRLIRLFNKKTSNHLTIIKMYLRSKNNYELSLNSQ